MKTLSTCHVQCHEIIIPNSSVGHVLRNILRVKNVLISTQIASRNKLIKVYILIENFNNNVIGGLNYEMVLLIILYLKIK